MAVVVTEQADSREGSVGSPESWERRIYKVTGAEHRAQAIEAIAAVAPTAADMFEGGAGQGLFFIPRRSIDAIPAGGPNIWNGFADYSSFSPDEFFLEIGGGTEHVIRNELTTLRYTADAHAAPDFKGLIGWNGEGFDGVDIPPHNLSAQYFRKKLFLPSQITAGFIATLNSMRFAVNDSSFYGLAAGVWTRDIGKAHRVARAIRAGTVWVNCYNVFDATAAFGGYKQSGYGRELGPQGLDLYTQTKSVWVQL